MNENAISGLEKRLVLNEDFWTLKNVVAQIVAEMWCGETPFFDPTQYAEFSCSFELCQLIVAGAHFAVHKFTI